MRPPEGSTSPQGLSRMVVAIVLLLLASHVAAKYRPYTWLGGDGRFYLNITKGLLTRGSLDQRGIHPTSWYEQSLGWNRNLSIAWSNVSRGRDGTYYPKHSYVMPALMLPLVAAFGEAGTLLYNNLAILAVVLLMFLLARRVADDRAAAMATVLLFAASFFLPSSYALLADFTHAGFALAALLLVLHGRWLAAGLCLGAAIWARPVNVVLLPPFGLLLALRWPGLRSAARFAGGLALPLLAYAALNTFMFGAPWVTSYQRVLIRTNGQLGIGTHADLYRVPLGEGLRRILVTPSQGLLTGSPVVGLALLGFPLLFARHFRLAIVAFAIMALNLLATAKFDVYHPRYYVIFVALAVLPGAALAERVLRVPAPGSLGPRWRLAALAAAALILGVATALTHAPHRPGGARGPTLSERAERMVVVRGTTPCDFWNAQHAAFECVGVDARQFGNLTGRVPSLERRILGTDAMAALWMVPGSAARPLVVRFPDALPPAAGFSLVLGTTTEAAGLPFEVEASRGTARLGSFSLTKAGRVERHPLRAAAGPRATGDLVLRISSRSSRARGLVVDGYPR